MVLLITSSQSFGRLKIPDLSEGNLLKENYSCNNTVNDENNLVEKPCLVCPQPDITISTTTPPWTNTTVNMCPGQKIIIQPNATLTLNNSVVRLDPSQSGSWGGIIVNGKSNLTVTNNSIITGATIAITGNKDFNSIQILESSVIGNNIAIYSAQGSPNGGVGTIAPINIQHSTFTNKQGINSTLFHVTNTFLYAINSRMYNLGDKSQGIGINCSNSKIYMQNCSINDFNKGINKNIGSGINSSSLFLYHCDILGSNVSIEYRDQNIFVQECILSGIVVQYTKCIGAWYSNSFLGVLELNEPQLSHKVYDNHFLNDRLQLNWDNSNTDAICNYWPHCGNAVSVNYGQGAPNIIKSDWGSPTQPSRNYHHPLPSGCQLQMFSFNTNVLINHYLDIPTHKFTYSPRIVGRVATDDGNSCPNKWRLDVIESIVGNPNTIASQLYTYNDASNHISWESYNQSYQQALIELGGADPSTNPDLRRQLEDARVGLGQCVVRAIATNNGNISQESMDNWITRADPSLEYLRIIMEKFFAEDFSSLINYLNNLPVPEIDLEDRNDLRDAINWMLVAKNSQKDLYNLSESDINDLKYFATTSFRQYTEVLRGWLNMNYGIFIERPLSSQNLINYSIMNNEALMPNYNISAEYQENNKCLKVVSVELNNAQVEVNGLDGKTYYSSSINFRGNNCLNLNLETGIYIVSVNSEQLNKPFIQTIFIK